MRKGSFAVSAIAGVVSWSALAAGQAAAPAKAPAAPAAAPASAARKDGAAPSPATPVKKDGPVPSPAGAAKKEAAAPSPAGAAKQDGAAPSSESSTESAPAAPRAGASTDAGAGTEAELPPAPPAASGTATPGAPPTARDATNLGPIGLWPQQGQAGATGSAPGGTTSATTDRAADEGVLAEDWWSHARPVFEIHGFFRTRGELFHNFSLGRFDAPGFATWPRPIDDAYTTTSGVTGGTSAGTAVGPKLCTLTEAGGPSGFTNPADPQHPLTGCNNKTQAGANLRFRLDPELHVSDNLRVISQVDLLDNLVMGSTPGGYAFQPASTGGYQVTPRTGVAPTGVATETAVPPTAGVNSLSNSIAVKRVWAEYTTPVGELRFGRMPDHFGLGMVHHSGDGYDDDYQSTVDRLQFITAIKPLDLYIGGSWDFPNEGPIRAAALPGGQAVDAAQYDDVNQWSLILMRKQSPELIKNSLAHEQVVLNGGAYVTLKKQLLANDQSGATATAATGANVPNATPANLTEGFARRGATTWAPDLWLQLRYKKFRFEAEAAALLGGLDSEATEAGATVTSSLSRKFREYGFATEFEQKLVEDRLRLGFHFGWASGDPNAYTPDTTNNLVAAANQQPVNSDTISTFRFNPAYRVDLILHRYLLQRVQGTYYLKPSVEYDFMRKPSGQRLGGGAGIVWSRASEFVQTPGHARDLGVELDGRLYFQAKDGGLNDKPEKMGGFYAMLEYGVLFPLAGLGYQGAQRATVGTDTSAAQILRLYLGVLF